MIDNDADQNEELSAAKDPICDIETLPNSKNGTKDAQDNSEQQAVVSKNFFDDVQKSENRRKTSQTMDSLLIDARHNLNQVAQITKVSKFFMNQR